MKTGETALEFLMSLRPALPMSKSNPKDAKTGRCNESSNGELRQWFKQGSVRINGRIVQQNEEVDFPVTDLVLFPKSKHRCTLY